MFAKFLSIITAVTAIRAVSAAPTTTGGDSLMKTEHQIPFGLPPSGSAAAAAVNGRLPDGYVQPFASANHEFNPEKNTCNPSSLLIFREQTSRRDTSAMLAFQHVRRTNCWLEFIAPSSPTGKKYQVDVFRQRQIVVSCPSTSNYRDLPLGRLDVPASGGLASWVPGSTSGDYLNQPGRSACPPAGSLEGFELVGVGQDVDIRWSAGQGYGLRIAYYT